MVKIFERICINTFCRNIRVPFLKLLKFEPPSRPCSVIDKILIETIINDAMDKYLASAAIDQFFDLFSRHQSCIHKKIPAFQNIRSTNGALGLHKLQYMAPVDSAHIHHGLFEYRTILAYGLRLSECHCLFPEVDPVAFDHILPLRKFRAPNIIFRKITVIAFQNFNCDTSCPLYSSCFFRI